MDLIWLKVLRNSCTVPYLFLWVFPLLSIYELTSPLTNSQTRSDPIMAHVFKKFVYEFLVAQQLYIPLCLLFFCFFVFLFECPCS